MPAGWPLSVLNVYARQLYDTLDAQGLSDAIPIETWALVTKQPERWREAVYAASQARHGGISGHAPSL